MALLPPIPRKYKGHLAIGVAAIAVLGGLAIYGEHGLLHLLHLQDAQHEMERTAFELQQHNERQRQHIAKLQSDDLYLERRARERLGMVRPGEVIYRVRPARPAAPR